MPFGTDQCSYTLTISIASPPHHEKKQSVRRTYRQRRISTVCNQLPLPPFLFLPTTPYQAPPGPVNPQLPHPLQAPKLQRHMRHPEATTPHPQSRLSSLAQPENIMGCEIGGVLQHLEADVGEDLRGDDATDGQVPRGMLQQRVAPRVDAEQAPEPVEHAHVGDEGGEGAAGGWEGRGGGQLGGYQLQGV